MRGKKAFRTACFVALLAVSGCGLRPQPEPSPPPTVAAGPVKNTPTPAAITPSNTPTPTALAPTPTDFVESGKGKALTVPSKRRSPGRVSHSNLPLSLPVAPNVSPGRPVDRLTPLLETAEATNMATDWRRAADTAVEMEVYPEAAQAYKNEAAIYAKSGDPQAAVAEQIKASYYSTELKLFHTVNPKKSGKLERWEPVNGCYVGAFIDRDDSLEKHMYESQTHGDIPQFNKLVEKPHASFFMYRSYGTPFPVQWAEYVKQNGAVPHIAWEPKDIKAVKDDAYLQEFMEAAARVDCPVVLRFAGEMNGEWTPYHGDPKAYVEAFRLVYKASRRAPKVVMLWCPNTVPQTDIEKYYPGDDYVDWVGVNFYSVPFLDNNPNRPGDKIYPPEQFKYVYDHYAKKKPMAIGEWAASRRSVLEDRDRDNFAVTKLRQLYAVLPTQYPRVKMVNWYDCNNIARAKEERQLNDFQLTHSPPVLDAYKRAIAEPYYLGAGQDSPRKSYAEIKGDVKLGSDDEVRLSLKSYDPTLKVYFLKDGKVLHASDNPVEWYIGASQLGKDPKGTVEIAVYDSKDRPVTRQKLKYRLKH